MTKICLTYLIENDSHYPPIGVAAATNFSVHSRSVLGFSAKKQKYASLCHSLFWPLAALASSALCYAALHCANRWAGIASA